MAIIIIGRVQMTQKKYNKFYLKDIPLKISKESNIHFYIYIIFFYIYIY